MTTKRSSNHKSLSRRDFLKAAGVTLGAAALSGVATACSDPSQTASEPQTSAAETEVETPSFTFGEELDMNQRVLVAYATRTGSTVGVASAIGETLGKRTFSVDVKPFKDAPSPEGYAAVVLGSAINGAQWLPEAVEYVKNHQTALKQTQVYLFCVHIMNQGDDEGSKKNRLAYLNAVRSLVQPVDEAYFAGMGMNPDETSGFVRWVYRTFKIGTEGDCRDWEKIRGWAETLC